MDPEVAGKLNEVVGRINTLGATNPGKVDDLHWLNTKYKEISDRVERFQRDSKSRFETFKKDLLGELNELNKEVDRRNNITQ